MVFPLSAALIFTLVLVGTIRWANHNLGHALVAFLAGFFVADTAAAPTIRNIIAAVAHALARL